MQRFSDHLSRIEGALAHHLPSALAIPTNLHTAMRYAVLDQGKRLRPLLLILSAELFDVAIKDCLPAAAAVEFIHAYSLVHDDLPAMDDDKLRRGKPTCHIAFDEATAILVGDALQCLAFNTLLQCPATDAIKISLIKTLTQAISSQGMVGGQALDVENQNSSVTLEALSQINALKTGALFTASVRMGAQLGGASSQALQTLETFTHHLGLAFQIQDDYFDAWSHEATLGKTSGSDERLNKTTFATLLGQEKAKIRFQDEYHQALLMLEQLPENTTALETLTHWLASRKN